MKRSVGTLEHGRETRDEDSKKENKIYKKKQNKNGICMKGTNNDREGEIHGNILSGWDFGEGGKKVVIFLLLM